MSEPITPAPSKNDKLQQAVLRNFLTKEGAIKHLPSQLKKRIIVLEYLASKMDTARTYTELEINAFLKPFNEDYATIRRELYIHRFVNREHDIYEVNEPGEWRNWRTLG
ncbi:DUF2087 domain-containing protein [Paenibacillus methanolicus]|uniref:DUF2087 domain-containing protein n=1 Tax=Paenibacillus methanolicus TaxID=582686 RepID=A0A5S5C1X0_9BACL|nr:DUF2087 domain-containing protein [Paenibacillus methanolicus]TYP73297.1 hypothetical protein BCM02_107281 [Paenibacillus methanolicus]